MPLPADTGLPPEITVAVNVTRSPLLEVLPLALDETEVLVSCTAATASWKPMSTTDPAMPSPSWGRALPSKSMAGTQSGPLAGSWKLPRPRSMAGERGAAVLRWKSGAPTKISVDAAWVLEQPGKVHATMAGLAAVQPVPVPVQVT